MSNELNNLIENNEFLCAQVDMLLRVLEHAEEFGEHELVERDGKVMWVLDQDVIDARNEIKELHGIIRNNAIKIRELSEKEALQAA